VSLCPHGYTAFWDCPTCPEPMGTAAPDVPRCEKCGGTILPPSSSGGKRGTCHCPENR